jgi:hypothetical protein
MGQGSENFKKMKMSVKKCLMQFDPKPNSRLIMNSYGLHHGIDDNRCFVTMELCKLKASSLVHHN